MLSYTKTKNVEVDDCIPDILWTRYWLALKDMIFFRALYINMIKVIMFLIITARLQAARAQST